MIQIHKTIPACLQHAATWAAFSAPLWAYAGQLKEPYSSIIYGIATLCSIISIMLAPPRDKPKDGDQP